MKSPFISRTRALEEIERLLKMPFDFPGGLSGEDFAGDRYGNLRV